MDGQYTDLELEGGQCAVSYGGHIAEWRVDLGGVKNIHHVLIHHGGKSILGIIYFLNNILLSKKNRCFSNYNNFRHKCRVVVNISSIMCVRLKRPDIAIYLILLKLT